MQQHQRPLAALILVTLALLAGCLPAPPPPPPGTPEIPEGWTVHDCRKEGFTIALPPAWLQVGNRITLFWARSDGPKMSTRGPEPGAGHPRPRARRPG